MRLGGRVQAAIEVLEDMQARKRPAADALKDWGLAHRFAGSGDRNAIGSLVYDTLRKQLSSAWLMDDDSAAATVFLTLHKQWGTGIAQMQEAFLDDKFAPEIPVARLEASKTRDFAFADAHIEADIPDWCAEFFEENFEEDWLKEAQALSERPPLGSACQHTQGRPRKSAEGSCGYRCETHEYCAQRYSYTWRQRGKAHAQCSSRGWFPKGLVRNTG